jgi:membrane peptidoglycan carboxypeptidase
VDRVTDDSLFVVYSPDRSAVRVLDEGVAVQTSLMLHEVVERGTAGKAKIPVWSAGKTGTTQSHRDAWFVGWGGGLSTAVWVGYPDAQVSMDNVRGIKVTGGSYPAQIWAKYMAAATSKRAKAVTPQSKNGEGGGDQVEVRICQGSMKLANSNCERTVDIHLSRGLVPKETCTLH